MRIFSPASEEMMAFYLSRQTLFEECSDALRYPKYSHAGLTELGVILKNSQAARFVLNIARFGDYSNTSDYWVRRRAVTEILQLKGIRMGKGKRPKPGFSEFVETVTPVLIAFGLKPSISDRSKLVRALRLMADEFGIQGDPREELRRVKKIERRAEIAACTAVWEAIQEGMRLDDE